MFFTCHRDTRVPNMAKPITILMAVAALTLLVAAAVHASVFGPIDPFEGAAPPEAILGVVLAAAAITALYSPSSRTFALGATVLALVGTLYGLTVTVPRGAPGDIAYHVTLLALLAVTAVLLVRPRPHA